MSCAACGVATVHAIRLSLREGQYNFMQIFKLPPMKTRWKQLIAEIREEGNKIKRQEKARRMVDKRMKLFLRTLQKEGVDRDSINRMNLFGDEDNDIQTEELMKKAYQQEHKETEQDKLLKAPIDLVRQAVKISMMMSGNNVSNFDEKNFKMVSPRFLPVVPEEDDEDDINFLSPSLFALHNDGSGIEKETSLASAMKIFGEKDNAALLNFIMEASGVSDALDNMKNGKYTFNNRQNDNPLYSPEGQPLWFSKENVTELFGEREKNKVEAFEKLQKSYTEEQVVEAYSIVFCSNAQFVLQNCANIQDGPNLFGKWS
ncbi:hypothetical protein Y032_0011g1512 [Ancylostoma ceylanicum]|uniref:Uncharacterized protein n=1 Tax=Ancylostoma ceylanicum TaxID=53326 RepID=A0A016VGY9_9BILA|nr:hypothetical protein Y032_0011g1512 [Ancylostoma ceylanicum]